MRQPINKRPPKRRTFTAVSGVLGFLALTLVAVTLTHAEEAGRLQTTPPSSISAAATPRQGVEGKVRVFDNALLDKIFAKSRAAAKREANPGALTAIPSTDSKPATSIVRPALLLPSDSFTAKITKRTPSTLAAALRFAEQGRKEIKLRQYQKALNIFERAVSLGPRSYLPYIYFYLAQTHYYLTNYQYAFNFLEVAESWLSDDSDWMTSISGLRQDSANAMGYTQVSGFNLR
jgi:hypothetical protein